MHHGVLSQFKQVHNFAFYFTKIRFNIAQLYLVFLWEFLAKKFYMLVDFPTVKVKQFRYRPGVAQRVPGS